MFRVRAEMLITCKQGLVELSRIWLRFSVRCFDMCSLASGLTPGVLQFCKMRQNNSCPPNRRNPGMIFLVLGSSLRASDTTDVENSLNVTNIYFKGKPVPSFLF